MSSLLLLLLLLLLLIAVPCAAAALTAPPHPSLKLRLSQVFTRHGDRTPLFVLPAPLEVDWHCDLRHLTTVNNDTHSVDEVSRLYRKNYMAEEEQLPGNCATGELTSVGAQQHQQLGAKIRHRYVDEFGLLPPEVDPSVMFLRSTDVPRTLASAMNFLEGLYPSLRELPKTGGLESILDIFTMAFQNEFLLPTSVYCPIFAEKLKEAQKLPEWENYFQKLQPLAKQLEKAWNLTTPIGTSFAGPYDTSWCRFSHQKPLPPLVDLSVLKTLSDAALFQITFPYSLNSVAQYGLGKLFQMILHNMETTQAGTNPHKFMLYSGHDTTIGPVLAALGIPLTEYPPYASHILVELFQNTTDGSYHVGLQYNGEDVSSLECPTPPQLCPWSSFVLSLIRNIPPNFGPACQPTSETPSDLLRHNDLDDFPPTSG